MNPDLQIQLYNTINASISKLKDISECDGPAKVIDWYEKLNPTDKENIHYMRNVLCDRTFELFAKKYSNTNK